MRDKKKKFASVDTNAIPILDRINININGDIYTFRGTSLGDCLMEAVDDHVEQEREFTEFINVSTPGSQPEDIYAPAVLCTFGYICKEELASFLVTDMIEEAEDETQDKQ